MTNAAKLPDKVLLLQNEATIKNLIDKVKKLPDCNLNVQLDAQVLENLATMKFLLKQLVDKAATVEEFVNLLSNSSKQRLASLFHVYHYAIAKMATVEEPSHTLGQLVWHSVKANVPEEAWVEEPSFNKASFDSSWESDISLMESYVENPNNNISNYYSNWTSILQEDISVHPSYAHFVQAQQTSFNINDLTHFGRDEEYQDTQRNKFPIRPYFVARSMYCYALFNLTCDKIDKKFKRRVFERLIPRQIADQLREKLSAYNLRLLMSYKNRHLQIRGVNMLELIDHIEDIFFDVVGQRLNVLKPYS